MDVTRLHLRKARPDSARPVQPLRAALPEFLLGLLVLAVGLAAGIHWPWVLAVACPLAVIALLRLTRESVELDRRRRAADEWLLWGATARPSSALLSWRAEELSSPRLRSALAHSLRRIEKEVSGVNLPGPVPLNKRALRTHLHLLRALHKRVADESRPASVRGMLLVDRLLTEPGSPLYSYVPDDLLAEALSDALTALDAPSLAAAA